MTDAYAGILFTLFVLVAIAFIATYVAYAHTRKKRGNEVQKISIHTSHNVVIEYYVASLGERILAHFIDMVVVVAYATVAFLILGALKNQGITLPGFVYPLFFIPVIFYDLIFEILLGGQSLGKKAMDIKVIRLDGAAPTLSAYLLRWLTGIIEISFFPFFGSIAMLMIIVSGQGQRTGDLIAGTAVVKTKAVTSVLKPRVARIIEGYQPSFPQVVQLTDKDMDILNEVLEVYHINGNFEPVNIAAKRVKTVLNIDNERFSPLEIVETVVSDYQQLTAHSE